MGEKDEKKVFHSFRHTIATMLWEAGCDNIAIEHLTGHSTGSKTVGQAVYTHTKIENLMKSLELLNFSFLEQIEPFRLSSKMKAKVAA